MKGQFYILFLLIIAGLLLININILWKDLTTNYEQILLDNSPMYGKDFEENMKYCWNNNISQEKIIEYINNYENYLSEIGYNISYIYDGNCINYTIFNNYYSYNNIVCH